MVYVDEGVAARIALNIARRKVGRKEVAATICFSLARQRVTAAASVPVYGKVGISRPASETSSRAGRSTGEQSNELPRSRLFHVMVPHGSPPNRTNSRSFGKAVFLSLGGTGNFPTGTFKKVTQATGYYEPL